MEAISRIQAIKQFFGNVQNSELIALKKADPKAFLWLGDEAAKALGKHTEDPTPITEGKA